MSRRDNLRQQLTVALEERGRRSALAAWLAKEYPPTTPKSWMVKLHRFLAGTDGVNDETALAFLDWLSRPQTTTSPRRGRSADA